MMITVPVVYIAVKEPEVASTPYNGCVCVMQQALVASIIATPHFLLPTRRISLLIEGSLVLNRIILYFISFGINE